MKATTIIAEIGVNHDGSVKLAKNLIDIASASGADAVKFQCFKAKDLVLPSVECADYQKQEVEKEARQFDMLASLELSTAEFRELAEYARSQNLEFITTCFDPSFLEEVEASINPARYKIGSGDLDNLSLLVEHARIGKPIILSTGIASLSDIELALSALHFGYTQPAGVPIGKADLIKRNFSAEALVYLKSRVTLLHCVSSYPAPADSLALPAIKTLKSCFGLDVGYSDHSLGEAAACAAVALGAMCVEKHITYDSTADGPDHSASLEPNQFASFVKSLRFVEAATASNIKAPQEVEADVMTAARRSLVAAAAIREGELLSPNNLVLRRAGGLGVPAADYFDYIGRAASRDYVEGELLDNA